LRYAEVLVAPLALVCGLICLAAHLGALNFSKKIGSATEFLLEELVLLSVLLTSVEF